MLTERLARMEAAELVERVAYQQRPPRYEYRLTAKGRGLLPALQEICCWANRPMPETWTPSAHFTEAKPD